MAKKIDSDDYLAAKEAYICKRESSGTAYKTCPICKKTKNIRDEYNLYFSKERDNFKVSNYCKLCGKKESKGRALEHYQKYKEKKIQYARDFRANQNNKEKIQTESKKYKAKYREKLHDCYLRDKLVSRYGFNVPYLNEHPEIVEMYRFKIKISRKLKSVKDNAND